MALDNIAALLHTSSRQASDVIEIACEGGGESPGDRALRRQVAAGLRLELVVQQVGPQEGQEQVEQQEQVEGREQEALQVQVQVWDLQQL